MGGFGECSCDHCEEVMQPYLDRELTPEEHAEAEAHLARLRVLREALHASRPSYAST